MLAHKYTYIHTYTTHAHSPEGESAFGHFSSWTAVVEEFEEDEVRGDSNSCVCNRVLMTSYVRLKILIQITYFKKNKTILLS